MQRSIAKLVFILVLARVDQLDSRAVEIVYTGDGCDCPKNLPYQVSVPVQPPPSEIEVRSYKYKLEAPAPALAKYTYSFDFAVEEPVPPPQVQVQKQNLYAVVDKVVLPKPDCVVEAVSSCAEPTPKPKPCQYDSTKVCTCGKCEAQQVEYIAPAYAKSCACGKCEPSNPQCRYVFPKLPSNAILRSGGRSKRGILPQKEKFTKFLQGCAKPFKTTRDAMKLKKSKLVKRDIKGEYDLLQKDQAALDLTIPEIIQYMPETLMPDFKRGKCNIGCKNCLSKHAKDQEVNSSPDNVDSDNVESSQSPEENDSTKAAHINSPISYNQQFLISPRFSDTSYIKRSVNPYQYHYPYYPALMPPPYMPDPLHLPTYAQNTGYPSWYQPRPLIDPHGHYVFDRLGHKYEVRNGGLKLMTPTSVYEGNVSAPVNTEQAEETEQAATPPTTPAEQAQGQSDAPTVGDQQVPQDAPTVGAPKQLDPNYDPQMEQVIRDIIYKHPDFIDASEHAPGSITQPQDVQTEETMQFLEKLVRGRLDHWFGGNRHGTAHSLQDLNRFSRETGASIKFIPVVTVDKEKLNRFRQEQSQLVL